MTYKATTVSYMPSPYELGRMYYKQNRRYNPYMKGTPAFIDFRSGYRREQENQLRRTQYHMPH